MKWDMRLIAFIALALVVPAPALAQTSDAVLLERARDQLEEAVRRNPGDYQAHVLLARTYSKAGMSEEAIIQYKIAAFGGDPRVMVEKADALADRADFTQALSAYEDAASGAKRKGDADSQIWSELGIAQASFELGRFERALELADRLEAGPPKPLSGRQKAKLYTIRGEVQGERARKEGFISVATIAPKVRGILEKGISYDPEYPRGHYALGRFFLQGPPGFSDKGKAEQMLAKATKMRRTDFTVRAWYIRALQENGKDDPSRTELAAFKKDFGAHGGARAMASRLEQGKDPM